MDFSYGNNSVMKDDNESLEYLNCIVNSHCVIDFIYNYSWDITMYYKVHYKA